jgi:hypothetical protein
MNFTVTYQGHARYTAEASQTEVTLALADYIEREPGESHARRAAIVLTQLARNIEVTDLGIVAIALGAYGFTAPEGTEPYLTDPNSDYVADLKL